MPRIQRRYARDRRAALLAARDKAFAIYIASDPHVWKAVGENPAAPGAVAGYKLFYAAPAKMRDFARQVNADQPHLALATGDLLERGPDYGYFLDIWDTITTPREFVPGNHDYTNTDPTPPNLMQFAADGLGFGTAPIIGGSRFTRSVGMSANGVDVRFLLIDTNVGRDETPVEANGHMTADCKAWVADQLATTDETNVFIVTHQGPHHYPLGWFVSRDALDLRDMVEAELSARPHRRIRGLFGHRHVVNQVTTEFGNLGRFVGYNIPAMLETKRSRFTKMYVFANGDMAYEDGTVSYP